MQKFAPKLVRAGEFRYLCGLQMDRYSAIRRCVQTDLERYECLFCEVLSTHVPLAEDVIRYLLPRRGKQLRPLMTLLAARVAGTGATDATLQGAVALELVHDASLIHDDVIDSSDERRGARTVNRLWGNRVAVLVGDFLLSRSLLCIGRTGSEALMGILARVVARLTEGELAQLSAVRSHLRSEEAYLDVIAGKTASLFGACMQVGALTAGAAPDDAERLRRVGELMGLVFQIRDDVFDYYPTTAALGKPTGHDIAEGKVTLPLLHALSTAPEADAAPMRALLEAPEPPDSEAVARLVAFAKAAGGIDYAHARMERLAAEARRELEAFPANEARSALADLIGYLIERDH